MDHNWGTQSGYYVEEYVIPTYDPFPNSSGVYYAFMAEVRWNKPTCLRYHDAQLLKDGRAIAATIEEDGTPGEPGWVWRFYVTERISGPVEWRVRVTGCETS